MDTHVVYVIVCASAWFTSMLWMAYSIFIYDLYHFFSAFALLFLSPLLLESLLNIYGCLDTTSLRFNRHAVECARLTEFKFPIIFTRDYKQSLFKLEKFAKIDSKLSSKVYKYLEEEEILDSKEEEDIWYEEQADKIKRGLTTTSHNEPGSARSAEMGKKIKDVNRKSVTLDLEEDRPSRGSGSELAMKIKKDTTGTQGGRLKTRTGIYSQKTDTTYQDNTPFGQKNFYHEPESPSRAFLLDKLSMFYLLRM